MKSDNHITAIIGGGFCGAMTAVHLLEHHHAGHRILLFDASRELGKGTAYSSYSERHLLNVAAGNMSAFPDRPDHFVAWLKKENNTIPIESDSLSKSFLPRSLYGRYLQEIFNNAIQENQDRVTIIKERVVACKNTTAHIELTTAAGSTFRADHAVLATGNFPPGKPKGIPTSFLNSPIYFSNPWDEKAVVDYTSSLPVLIAGTGLTMVDVVIGLREKGYSGKIVALSPKGFEILPHRVFDPQPEILKALNPPYRLQELVTLFKKYVRQLSGRGISGEAIVDAVRSRTPEIWAALSLEDRRRFLAHLRHLWGVARHRLPAEVFERIKTEIVSGKLSILPGRILDVDETTNHATVTYYNRLLHSTGEVKAGRIINCTGPQNDITRMGEPLFNQLIADGLITPDPLGMGITCDPSGRPLTADGSPNPHLHAIGSLLKGDLWESTAVPELRKQAHATAQAIVEALIEIDS